MSLSEVFKHIKVVKDFPTQGIIFRHIGPLLNNEKLFKYAIKQLYSCSKDINYDVVAGLDARGFIIATALQYEIGIPQVMIRKKSKLPGIKYTCEYKKEYGSDTLELEADSIKPGQKVLIVDDLIATAGTITAAANLIEQAGGIVAGIMVLIEFSDLGGRLKLDELYPKTNVFSLFSLNSQNDTEIFTTEITTPNHLRITKYIPKTVLNYHFSGEKKIIDVYVASTNLSKLDAVYEATYLKESSIIFNSPRLMGTNVMYEIYSVSDIQSEIPEQPFSKEETSQGALNRLNNCIKTVNKNAIYNRNAIYIAIENGIIKENENYYDVPVIKYKIFDGEINENIFIASSIKIPELYNKYIQESLSSPNRSITFGSLIEKKLEIKDWHKYVSGKSRKDLILASL